MSRCISYSKKGDFPACYVCWSRRVSEFLRTVTLTAQKKTPLKYIWGIFLGSKFCWEGAVFIFQSAQEDIDIDSRNLRGAWCFQPGWKRHAGRIRNHLPKNIRGNKSKIRWARKLQMEWHTVDGTNPAPVDTVNIPLFTGFYTSQVVQDFFHQQ